MDKYSEFQMHIVQSQRRRSVLRRSLAGIFCRQNDPKIDPSIMTATSARIAPTIATITISR